MTTPMQLACIEREQHKRELRAAGLSIYRSPSNSLWNDERVAELKKLLEMGLSARKIAAAMNCGFTRNSIISKLHRIGLRGLRPQGGQRGGKRTQRPRRATTMTLFKRRSLLATDLPVEQPTNPVTLFALEANHCRWPCTGTGMDTIFCGAETEQDRSYCTRHCCVAYKPAR